MTHSGIDSGPTLSGRLRCRAEDFFVDEQLGFEPDGDGEHVLVRVQKTGANTAWVAAQLARCAGVKRRDVGFAGRKDRHAVTLQWFSIWMPGATTPAIEDWDIEGVEFLDVKRHRRKLRPGSLAANRFEIVVRELIGQDDEFANRVARAARDGVPNYFGEQRFGNNGSNLVRAREMFAGARLQRNQRSLALSAARAEIFNGLLAARVADGSWCKALPGDCLNLDGSRSFFLSETPDEDIAARMQSGDLHVTGPMWGVGELPTRFGVQGLELQIAGQYRDLADGLARAGLRQERRSLRLLPRELVFERQERLLRLRFTLAPGLFATTVVAALVQSRVS